MCWFGLIGYFMGFCCFDLEVVWVCVSGDLLTIVWVCCRFSLGVWLVDMVWV